MRLSLSLFILLICFTTAFSQTTPKKKTTAKKTTVAAKKPVAKPKITPKKPTTATAKRPPAKPAPPAPAEPVASTLTFPSTETDTEGMDEATKQKMYDDLHGVNSQTTQPETGNKRRRRDSGETATRIDRAASRPTRGEAGTYIGVRVGGNYTTFLEQLTILDGLGGSTTLRPDAYYGFHAGVVFQFGRGGVAFQPELNYHQDFIQTPSNPLTTTGVAGGTTTESARSLVVPLLAKFQFGQLGNTRFFVNVGPYGTYSLQTKAVGEQSIFGYGGALGIGLGIPTGSGKFTVEARSYYQLGVTGSNIPFGEIPFKPLIAQFSIGYLFPAGGR